MKIYAIFPLQDLCMMCVRVLAFYRVVWLGVMGYEAIDIFFTRIEFLLSHTQIRDIESHIKIKQ